MATLWISSWMMTVLPTPAPPNRPILPPLTNGAIRSTTLMPVSNTSVLGSRSTNFGASRWMGQRSTSAGIGGPSSTGSPSPLRPRPSWELPWSWSPCSSFQSFRPTDDLRQLLGDLRLPRPVEGAPQHVENVPGAVGGVLHRGATRAVLTRRRLDQRPVHLVVHVQGQQGLEDRLRRRFENVEPGGAAIRRGRRRGDREHAQHGRRRRHRAVELREHDLDPR